MRSSRATVAAVPASAFWWQWPWKTIGRPLTAEPGSSVRRAVVDRLDEQLLDQPRLVRDDLRARVVGQQGQVLLAQRQQARRLAADDRHAALGLGREPLDHRLRHPARLVEQALGDARAPAAAGALEPHAPAGGLQQLDRRAPDRGLGEGRERVGEEDDVAARARRRRATACGPSARASGGRSAAAGGGGRCRRRARAAPARQREVRERRGGGAEAVERAGSRRTAASAAAPRARPGSARGTRTSSSPCRRSAGTRSCTPCTRGRGRGSRAAARRPSRPSGPARTAP